MTHEINNLDAVKNSILDLASGITKISADIQKLQVSLVSLQTVVAVLVDPSKPLEAWQRIRDQDQLAQALAPATELEKVRLMLDTLKKNPSLGKA
jgi:hypothetical protein